MPSAMLCPMRAYGASGNVIEAIIKFTKEVRVSLQGGFFDQWGWGPMPIDAAPDRARSDEIVELKQHQYLGGAVMAFHRNVLTRILESGLPNCALQGFWPFFQPITIANEDFGVYEYLSEDWAICHKARRAGVKVYALMRPVTIHHGAWSFTALDGNNPDAASI